MRITLVKNVLKISFESLSLICVTTPPPPPPPHSPQNKWINTLLTIEIIETFAVDARTLYNLQHVIENILEKM